MKTMMAVAAFALAIEGLAGCASEDMTTKAAPSPTPAPVITYADYTVDTVRQGAALYGAGYRFLGYSPITVRGRLENGVLTWPIAIVAMPTAPGEYTQEGGVPIGAEAGSTWTIYMYSH